MKPLASDAMCHYCGAPATTRDHIVPKALGGTNARVNIAPACEPCNTAKGQQWPEVMHKGTGVKCSHCVAAIAHFQRIKPRVKGERRDLVFPEAIPMFNLNGTRIHDSESAQQGSP